MKSVALTHLGAVRENNEDAIFADDMLQLYIVADGMGGYQGGEIASAMAIEIVVSDCKEMISGAEDVNDIKEGLRQAIYHANDSIYQCYQKGTQNSPMGTTLTVVYIRDGIAYIGHVGDSRAYLLHTGEAMRQLTKDHSVIGEMLEKGEISPEEAKTHPSRHMLTRAIGYFPLVDVDITVLAFAEEDRILLCTDGLYNLVSEEEIAACLQKEEYPVAKLIARALERGGFDNISAVYITNHFEGNEVLG